MILDGVENPSSAGVVFRGLSVFSEQGSFGLVVQNAVEETSLREGLIRNDFSSADMKRKDELFIIDTFFELQ